MNNTTPFGPRQTTDSGSAGAGWSRRGFLGVLGAVGIGTVVGCADAGSDAQSVIGRPVTGSAPLRRPDRTGGGARLAGAQPYAPTKPYQLASVCELSEDYFLVQNHSIDPDKDKVVAYSRSDGLVEAIVLQDGVVKQVLRDPTQPGGWQVNPLPDAEDVIDMVAGVSGAGGTSRPPVLTVCYVKSTDPRNPTPSDLLTVATQTMLPGSTTFATRTVPWSAKAGGLQVSLSVDGGLLIAAMVPASDWDSNSDDAQLHFLGTNPAYDLTSWQSGSMTHFTYDPTRNGGWAAVIAQSLPDVEVARTIHLYFPDTDQPTVQIRTAKLTGGVLTASSPETRLGGLPQPPEGGLAVTRVEYLSTLGSKDMPTALVWTERSFDGGVAGNPRLWAVTYDPYLPYTKWVWTDLGLPGSITQGPSEIPVSTALVPRSQSGATGGATVLLDIFVVLGDTLHVLRQIEQAKSTDDSRHPAYTPLIPLQPGVATMTSQAAASTGNELMVIGTDHVLQTLEKDPVSGRWVDAELQLPAESLQQDSAYRVTLTLSDVAWNAAVAGATLKITASSAAPATIEDAAGTRSVVLGTEPVSLTTDDQGDAVVALLADGLYAPTLTISTDGLETPASVQPSGPVNAYMSGDTKQKLNYLDPLSPAGLTNAKTPDGITVAPGAGDAAAAGDAFATMTQAATWGAAGSSAAVSSTLGRVDGNRAHLRDHRHRHPHPPTRLSVKAQGAAINNWFHDAMHAIKKGAVKVTKIVVDVANKVMQLAADFAHWADNVVQVIVKTVEDAAHVLHATFNKLAADIVHVVKWLEAEVVGLLKDSAYVAGKLSGWLDDCCTFVGTEIVQQKDAVDRWLTSQEAAIQRQFDAIRARFGPKVTLANIATNPPAALGSRRPRILRQFDAVNPPGDAADPDAHPHGDWFFRKVKHALSSGGLNTPDLAGADVKTLIDNLVRAAGTALADFAKAFADFAKALTAIVTHPDKAGTVGISMLLNGVSEMLHGVFTLARAAVDTVFDLFAGLVKVVGDMLATNVGSMKIVGELLTLAGLGKIEMRSVATMILAFPTALAYKVAHGSHSRPFDGVKATRSGKGLAGNAQSDLKFTGSSVMGVWAFFDVIAAGYTAAQKEPPMFLAAIDIAAPVIVAGLTPPMTDGDVPTFANPVKGDNHAQMIFASWILGVVPAFVAMAGIYVDHLLKAKKYAKDEAGTVKDSLLWVQAGAGLFSLVTGVIGASLAETPSGADYAVAVLNNVAPGFSPLLSDEIVEATVGGSAAVEMVLTAFCGLSGAVVYGTSS
ncbi:hypothetical protein [Microlunatus ginsengisoli]|uniref:Uncharacterized protein n=1 Tax=Microlunatus ginsengisoli TaxID=363863 RepID=A0ABP6ZQT7_9ACTN